jgi:hypothetical protein
MNSEIDASIRQSLMDFFGKEPLPPQLCQRTILHGVARCGDEMLGKRVHAAQNRAKAAENFQEIPGLNQGERRGAGANAKGQRWAVMLGWVCPFEN